MAAGRTSGESPAHPPVRAGVGEAPRRRLGRTGRTVPVIGADLTLPSGLVPDRTSGVVRTALGAWSQGVELFDLACSEPEPREVALGEAKAQSPRGISAFLAVGSGGSNPPREGSAISEQLSQGLRTSLTRIGRPADGFAVILPNQLRWLERSQTVDTLESLTAAGTIGGWGLRLTVQTRLDRLGPVLEAGADFLVLPGNLLDHRLAQEAAQVVEGTGVSLVLSDPHAHGALDGGFLRAAPAGAPLARPFEPWDALERRLRPVTRLGFLTGQRTRSLAEAAVQFDLQLPAVAAVLVDPSEPTVVRSAFSALERPPIASDDLERLEAVLAERGSPSGRPARD